MTLDEIKASVDAGLSVYWRNVDHPVIKDDGEYKISHHMARYPITRSDGVTVMSGIKLSDFFGAKVAK